jgi:deoxyadenosine/deoxycytidine kinase
LIGLNICNSMNFPEIKLSTIEGSCFAGKTTLLEELKSKYGVKIVEEYDTYANGGLDFPTYPQTTIEDIKVAIDFFIGIDRQRSEKAIELSMKYDKPILMDRSPLSCIIFQKLAYEYDSKNSVDAFAYTVDRFREEVEAERITFPSVLVYLEPDSLATFYQRIASRGVLPIPFLNTKETLESTRQFYETIIRNHHDEKSAIILKSKDGDLDFLCHCAYEFLEHANYNHPLLNLEIIKNLSL